MLTFLQPHRAPECQVPLAMRTDVIDQNLILEIAMHPAYDCYTAKVLMEIIVHLTQSSDTHAYIVTREIAENMLKICERRHKMIIQTQQREKEESRVSLL